MFENKVGIFSFYDKDGIIDDYVVYYLEAMSAVLNQIVFVSNGKLAKSEEKKINHLVCKIIIRDNKGFDAGAYKDVILNEKLGILKEASELVLFNDTVFGPFYSLEDVFYDMDKKDIDFWGFTRHKEAVAWGNYVPECVQSYFICIRQNMLRSDEFTNFWNNIPNDLPTLEEVVLKFEFTFTRYFESRGFKWGTYIDISELESEQLQYNISPTYYANYELIRYKRFPFLKRKNFIFQDGYKLCNGEDIRLCIDYIREKKLFDVTKIWKNVLRIYNMRDIYTACHLAFISPTGMKYSIMEQKDEKAILVVQITNDITARYYVELIAEIETEFDDIFLCIDTEKILKIIMPIINHLTAKVHVTQENIERILLTHDFSNQDLLCAICDENYDSSSKIVNKSINYAVIGNLIDSIEMIRKIKLNFTMYDNLGVLFAPDSYIGSRCLQTGGIWTEDKFNKIKELYERLGLSVPFDRKHRQLSNAVSFWCKTEILIELSEKIKQSDSIFAITQDDLAGILPYYAQQKFYYSGISISSWQSQIEYVNYREIMTNMFEPYREDKIEMDLPFQYIRGIRQIRDFCCDKEKIYIYGAGEFGYRVYKAIADQSDKILGFVVTRMSNEQSEYCGYPVFEKGQMLISDKIGVIIAMSVEKQNSVLEDLKKMGVHNIYRV